LEDAQRAIAVAGCDKHGHLVGSHVSEADSGEAELRRDRGDNQPVAVDRCRPEVEENRNLDELDDRVRQLSEPVGGEAEQKAALGLTIDGALLGDVSLGSF